MSRGCWEEGRVMALRDKGSITESRATCSREKMTRGQQDPTRGRAETLAELWEPSQNSWSSIEPLLWLFPGSYDVTPVTTRPGQLCFPHHSLHSP